MTDDDRLRLIALDEEDLAVLSAYAQDAVIKVGDMAWLKGEKRFVMAMNRFAWEATLGASRRSEYQRRRSALHFERVAAVVQSGIDQDAKDAVLDMLAIRFEPRNGPAGDIHIDFAGGATVRLAVECVEAQLADLGPAWSTPHAPRHVLG